jgi:hypothetical protein
MKPVCLLVLFSATVFAQQPAPAPSMQAESSGKCSPNILSNQGRVQFVCNATMDTATAAKIVSLLNRILQQESDSGGNAEVNSKLDEILGFLRTEAQAREPRQLPGDQLEAVRRALSTRPAKIWIWYSGQDGEAYQLAKQISEILVDSHWTLKQPITGMMLLVEGGGPLPYGIEVKYRGEKPLPGARVTFDSSTPWGVLCGVLMHFFPQDVYLDPEPNLDADIIWLSVYPNPKSKPATMPTSK